MKNDNGFDPLDLDADQFTAHLIMQGLADQSVRAYRAIYVRWCDWCDWCSLRGCNPHALNPIELRNWSRDGIKQSRAMLAQARAMIGHLGQVCDWPDDAGQCIRTMPRHRDVCEPSRSNRSRQ